MSELAGRYLRRVVELIETLASSQAATIDRAAGWVAEAIGTDHRVYVAKTSHTLHTETFLRAGGLAAAHPLGAEPDYTRPMLGAETAERLGDGEWEPEPGDVVLVGTNAGTDVGTVEIALACRRRGCRVVALTSVDFERAPGVAVEHPSGQALHEVADLVIDIGGEVGDALIQVPGLDERVAPASGVLLVAATWAILAGAAERLAAAGKAPLVYRSVQLPGGEALFEERLREYRRTRRGYRPLR